MIIDIVLIALALIALIVGWRKGFIVQLLQLIGLYIAVLIAPDFADEVGKIFTDDPGLAYLAGFGVIIIGAWIVIWVIAPLFRKILFFDTLRALDSLLTPCDGQYRRYAPREGSRAWRRWPITRYDRGVCRDA